MLKFTKYLRAFRKEVFLGPLFKLAEAIFELIVPLVMAKIIDIGIVNRDVPYVLRMGGILLLLGGLGLGFALICQYFAAKASQGFGTVVRDELFRQINTLSHAELDRFGTPSLITRITNDVNQLQLAVAMLIRLVVRAPFLVVGATVMAMMMDWRLSCVFLVAAPLVALGLYWILRCSIPFYRLIQKKLDTISLITRENLIGARVIRAFSRQKAEKQRFDKASNDQMETSIAVSKLSALLNPMTFSIINLSVVAVVWFGGVRVNTGALTQGQVIAFVNYLSQILLALIVVANLVVIFTKASASAARINEILETQAAVRDTGTAPLPLSQPDQPRIAVEDVSFSYHDAGEAVLRHLSFQLYPGQSTGIIGGTGSGKTTLVTLLSRFYDVSEGQILYNGTDIRALPLAQLRHEIGIVPQEAVLFSGTLRENLQWRQADADDCSIWDALQIAQAKEFVDKLPDGLDSWILQGGKNLSGGQRQRLTIARALLDSPAVLILDDSASALDYVTDDALRKEITQLAKKTNATILTVSQRVSSVQQADQIIVLEDGRIAGIGTHRALLSSCPPYQEVCASQQPGQISPQDRMP